MIRSLGRLLPGSLQFKFVTAAEPFQVQRCFKAVADAEIDFNNRETLKKYVGVRDHLSKEPGTKGRFMEALSELADAIKVLPSTSDYRRAVEATIQYRRKVCEQNEADAAVEEVLDSHLEELIKECKEEKRLVPLLLGAFVVSSLFAHCTRGRLSLENYKHCWRSCEGAKTVITHTNSNTICFNVHSCFFALTRRKPAMERGSRPHGKH
jgi:NADH dehydrogenase (ubiquinone) 1 alpha subcomplex subunit 5